MNTIFYIVAHADDWQLFMNPEAYNDLIAAGNKVVFIVTTAGDAGKEKGFWRAREEGMKSSILYCLVPVRKLVSKKGFRKIQKQKIAFWTVNNIHCFFLRLPDGGVTGTGFKENNYENLLKLEEGQIAILNSLDGFLTFNSWKSFCDLLQNIISIEAVKGSAISIKFLNPDIAKNPLDHADHQATGRAILSLQNLPPCRKVLFNGYGNSCSKKLKPDEFFWKSGMFMAYEKTVFDQAGYSTLAEDINLYKKWILSQAEMEYL